MLSAEEGVTASWHSSQRAVQPMPPQAASRRQWRKWRARTTTGKGYSLPRPPSGRRLVALSLMKKKRRVRLELHSIPATIHAGLSQSGLLVI